MSLSSAIPYALDYIGDLYDLNKVMTTKKYAREEARAVAVLFCSFEWNFVLSGTDHLLRDVVDTTEFRARLGNILSRRKKYICRVWPLVHDLRILKDEDIECNEAMLFVEFAPWISGDALTSCACIEGDDEHHRRDKHRICLYCGSYDRSHVENATEALSSSSSSPSSP